MLVRYPAQEGVHVTEQVGDARAAGPIVRAGAFLLFLTAISSATAIVREAVTHSAVWLYPMAAGVAYVAFHWFLRIALTGRLKSLLSPPWQR
jgi:hypothetical protein